MDYNFNNFIDNVCKGKTKNNTMMTWSPPGGCELNCLICAKNSIKRNSISRFALYSPRMSKRDLQTTQLLLVFLSLKYTKGAWGSNSKYLVSVCYIDTTINNYNQNKPTNIIGVFCSSKTFPEIHTSLCHDLEVSCSLLFGHFLCSACLQLNKCYNPIMLQQVSHVV